MTDAHVSEALDEMLVAGGTLTMRLLGGELSRPDKSPERHDEPENGFP